MIHAAARKLVTNRKNKMMRIFGIGNLPLISWVILIIFLFGCSMQPAPSKTAELLNTPIETTDTPPTQQTLPADSPELLNRNQIATLSSLKKIDDYPLYTMHYLGELPGTGLSADDDDSYRENMTGRYSRFAWACSLFAALGGNETPKFGRNFDWEFSPALLLFTNPGDGYKSASMVDIAYLGFETEDLSSLEKLDLTTLTPLLQAPNWPFDGMNEAGLAIGMAAVPSGQVKSDPLKPIIGSLEIMRQILDHASDTQEALRILSSYSIDFRGGPDLHYLIADRSGDAILVEFFDGSTRIIHNTEPWHLATNFLVGPVDNPAGKCPRYDKLSDSLLSAGGNLNSLDANELLSKVSQNNTQWSVVYNLDNGDIDVTMGTQIDKAYKFQLVP